MLFSKKQYPVGLSRIRDFIQAKYHDQWVEKMRNMKYLLLPKSQSSESAVCPILKEKDSKNGWFIRTVPPAVQTVKPIGVTDAHSLFWNGQWYHSGKVQQRNEILGKWTSPELSRVLLVIGEIHLSLGGFREPSGASLPYDSSDLSPSSARAERTNLD